MFWQNVYLVNRIEEERWARRSEINRIARQGIRRQDARPTPQAERQQHPARVTGSRSLSAPRAQAPGFAGEQGTDVKAR